jgi:hypothetical protein
MNNELERMMKEAAMTKGVVLANNLSSGTDR